MTQEFIKISRLKTKYHNQIISFAIVLLILVVHKYLYSSFFVGLQEEFFFNKFWAYEYIVTSKYIAVLTICLVLITSFISIKYPIRTFELPKTVQILFYGTILILVWSFSLYEYNYYFDSWQYIDRILLVILATISIYNPYLSVFFIMQACLISRQFSFPNFFIYSFTDKQIIFDTLLLIWIFLIAKFTLPNKIKYEYLLIIFFAIIGNWYFQAGMGKWSLNWRESNHLVNLLASCASYGWDGFGLSSKLSLLLTRFNVEINILTLIIEILFPLLIMVNKTFTKLVLFGFISFHISVFLVGGIFFWKWIILEILALVGMLFWKLDFLNIYKKKLLTTYILILAISPSIFRSTRLAWFDSGLTYLYSFYLVDEASDRIRLDASFFSPYDLPFAQNRFHFIDDNLKLSGTFGATKEIEVVQFINDNYPEVNGNEFNDLKDKYGKSYYDPIYLEKFKKFLYEFISNKLEGDKKVISYLDPPMHINQGENQQNIDFNINQFKSIEIIREDLLTVRLNDVKCLASDTIKIIL